MHGVVDIRTSVQSQPAAEAQGHRYDQRPSRTVPGHTPGAPLRRWGGVLRNKTRVEKAARAWGACGCEGKCTSARH